MKPDEINRGLPGDDADEQARFIEGVFSVENGAIRVCSLYLPNGNPPDDPVKYPYKLAWMERLRRFAEDRLALEEPLILAGDYNVIPEPFDCHDPRVWEGDALFLPQTRVAFRKLEHLGFTDAARATTDEAGLYSFWDYQAGAWPKNNGIRIDHLMLSAEAADRLQSVNIENMCGHGKNRPTTCRSAVISISGRSADRLASDERNRLDRHHLNWNRRSACSAPSRWPRGDHFRPPVKTPAPAGSGSTYSLSLCICPAPPS